MKFLINEDQFKKIISKTHKDLKYLFINEGQNEDRAKSILDNYEVTNSDEILMFLKKIDQSKNNKLLPVIATFYVNASTPEEHSEVINTFKDIFKRKNIPEINLKQNGEIYLLNTSFTKNEFSDFKNFIEHYFYDEEDEKKEKEKIEKIREKEEIELVDVNANKIFENNNFIIWKAIHEKICIQLFGRDNENRMFPITERPYCIGWGTLEDPATHLRGYRTDPEKKYTFYAVLDKKKYEMYDKNTKEYPPSMLNIVGIRANGIIEIWADLDVTNDLSPAFSSPQEYLNYLENNGVNLKNVFKIILYTPRIDELIKNLMNNPENDDLFKKMTPFMKKDYAKQTKILTPTQIKFFLNAGDLKTLDTFVKNYTTIGDISAEAFKLLPSSLQKSYLRSKLIQFVNESDEDRKNNSRKIKINVEEFIERYIINSNLIQYAINFIKDSFENEKNKNLKNSEILFGHLRPEVMLEYLQGQIEVEDKEEVEINKELFKLKELPENFGKYLVNAKKLIFKNLNITNIPNSILMLKNLEQLSIYNCNELVRIPEIGQLSNLEEISINNCSSITELPQSIVNLKNLRALSLVNDQKLHFLPDRIDKLENLEILNIKDTPLFSLPKYELSELTSLLFLSYNSNTMTRLKNEDQEFLTNFGQ